MKLLLDQNISRKILPLLQNNFPQSNQVYLLNLHEADDKEIWDYAKIHGFTLVTKDSDFQELSLIYGFPPKIIWLRCGNQTNQVISELLLTNSKLIKEFIEDNSSICLEIY